MGKIVPTSHEGLAGAANALQAGELIGLPTETVYGLAGDATKDEVVAKIFAAKRRPRDNPLIVHIADAESAERWVVEDRRALDRLNRLKTLWPGPLTVIMRRAVGLSPLVGAGSDTVALRIPAHEATLKLLGMLPFPLAAPSANPSGYISPTRPEHVIDQLGESVSLVLDGGECRVGIESTVLSLIDETPNVLRCGAVTPESLEELLGEPVGQGLVDTDQRRISPGMGSSHYAPRTKLMLRSDVDDWSLLPRPWGFLSFGLFVPPVEADRLYFLSRRGDLSEIARSLYSQMRLADKAGLKLIVSDVCNFEGLGGAIMDRLIRGTAPRS